MEPPSTTASPFSTDSGFAELLASIAVPANPESPWNDDDLVDDVATISYEQALRTHARSRTSAAEPDSPAGASMPEATVALKPLKTASITIRLSEGECAQLRQRAAESGLTVSAYLRSCTLEVESLRAQVKQTLAEMRTSTPTARPQETTAEPTGWFAGILFRLRSWAGQLRRGRRRPFALNPANPFAPVRYSS